MDGLSVERRAEFWKGMIERDRGHNLVVELNGEIVGFAHSGPCNDPQCDPSEMCQLNAIYIQAEYQGQGCGTGLFKAIEAWASDRGFYDIRVLVLDTNDPARRFYEKMGMTTSGVTLSDSIDGCPVSEVVWRINGVNETKGSHR